MPRILLISLLVMPFVLMCQDGAGSDIPGIDPSLYVDARLTAAGYSVSAASFLMARFVTSDGQTIEIVFPRTRSIHQYSLMACIEGAIAGKPKIAGDDNDAWVEALHYSLMVKIPKRDHDDFSQWIITRIDATGRHAP